jgi:hypothetical protein
MTEYLQLGDLLKTNAIGKRIKFDDGFIEFHENCLFVKILDREANILYLKEIER